jgi:hypothetical protein
VPTEVSTRIPSESDEVPVDNRNAEPDEVRAEMPQEIEFSVFPNPANEFVNLSWKGIGSGTKLDILLLNELGQQVSRQTIDDAAIGQARFELANYRSGSYLLMIKQEGEAPVVKKLLIVR